MANFVRKYNSTELLLAVPWSDTARIDFIREQIRTLPISAKLLPDTQVRTLTNYASSGGQRVVSIEIQRAPFSATERFAKRAIDISIALVALVFFCPLWSLLRLQLDWTDAGPLYSGRIERDSTDGNL